MARDVKTLESRIRGYTNCTDSSNLDVSPGAIEGYINASLQWLAFWCGIGQTKTAALVVIAPNVDGYDVTVPNSKSQFGYVASLTLRSQGLPLQKESPEFIRELRAGPPGSETLGYPTHYSLVKLSTGVERLEVWPRPILADNLDGVSAEIPDQIDLDRDKDTVLPFGNNGFEAMALYAAALAIDGMSQDVATKLRIDKGSAGSKSQQAEKLANSEAAVIATQFLQDEIERGDA